MVDLEKEWVNDDKIACNPVAFSLGFSVFVHK